jgi:hypothetical protein
MIGCWLSFLVVLLRAIFASLPDFCFALARGNVACCKAGRDGEVVEIKGGISRIAIAARPHGLREVERRACLRTRRIFSCSVASLWIRFFSKPMTEQNPVGTALLVDAAVASHVRATVGRAVVVDRQTDPIGSACC